MSSTVWHESSDGYTIAQYKTPLIKVRREKPEVMLQYLLCSSPYNCIYTLSYANNPRLCWKTPRSCLWEMQLHWSLVQHNKSLHWKTSFLEDSSLLYISYTILSQKRNWEMNNMNILKHISYIQPIHNKIMTITTPNAEPESETKH